MQEPTTPEYLCFKKKRNLWVSCMSGADPHSIQHQIGNMLWDAAVYRIVNEARRIAAPAPGGGVQLNGPVHGLMDKGFYIGQMMAVRRLKDRQGLYGQRGTYSLAGLLQDIKDNAHLMRREHLFAAEGMEYDCETVRREYQEWRLAQDRAGKKTCPMPIKFYYCRHEQRHRIIDDLAGVQPTKRCAKDVVRPEIPECLLRRLNGACDRIHAHANKFVAHAATPQSRASMDAKDLRVSLGDLWNAHETIYKIAVFVSVHLLNDAMFSALPVPSFDQFDYIDRPLVPSDHVGDLAAAWDAYEAETKGWRTWEVDAFVKGIEQPGCASG